MPPDYILFKNMTMPKSLAESMRDGSAPPARPWQENPNLFQRLFAALPLGSDKDAYVQGIDISKWQGSWNVQKTKDAGAQYAFIKASQNKFTDSKFDEFVSNAYAANFPIGLFHFADPAGYSAIQQAQYFADLVKGVGELSVVLDMEWTGGRSPLALSQWGEDFIGEVSVHLGDRLKEIYTRMSWWNSYVALSPWVKENNVGLWAARWASWLDGPWSDGKYTPRPAEWTDWTNWQHSADGNGLGSTYGVQSGSIDLNYFHGDWDVFVAHYMPAPPEPPTPPVDPDIIKRIEALEVKTDATNLRVSQNELEIRNLWTEVGTLQEDITTIQAECCGDATDPDSPTLNVVAKEKIAVFKTVGYDKSCEDYIDPGYDGPGGKPIAEPPALDARVVYEEGAKFKINAKAYVSCKDNPYDYIVHGSGYDFGVISDGQLGAGDFVRLDKIDIL